MDTTDTTKKRLLSVVSVVSFVVITAAIALAQDQPPPVFKAGVELVRLDVRVTDADGQPIRDLRQDEVHVVEAGSDRPVVFFQHIEEPRETYDEAASHTVSGEVSTNQGAARGHLYLVVFDQMHISPGGEQRARQAIEQFLKTRMRRGDRAALYALPGPGPQIPFTSDVKRIVAELPKVRGMQQEVVNGAMGTMTIYEAYQILRRNELVLERVAQRNQDAAFSSDSQRRVDASTFGSSASALTNLYSEDAQRITNVSDGETRRLLASLSDVLRQMRTIEGRKTVLFVSEGFYDDRLRRELQDVAAAAAESYSVVHAFDVNQHEFDASADTATGADQANEIHDKLSPLGSLAAETGGSLVIDANRRTEAFTAIADQSQDYYLIGFAPDATGSRDTYRPVTVRVSRRGAEVSTRTGFALTDASKKLGRHQAIERAMAAPFAQQGLPLQYTTYVLRGTSAGMQRVILSLAVDLPLATSAQTDTADVAFVVRAGTDGRVSASGHDTLPLPTSHGRESTTGVGSYHVQFELPAGDYLMRAVIREPGGLVGSADRRFTVRALDGPSVTGGDLVLSAARGELPVRPTAYLADGLSGVLELYGRNAQQVDTARVLVDLVPIGESQPVVSGSCDLQEVRIAPNGNASREARLALPLEGVAAGTYVARARVMVGSETAAEIVRDVEVRAGRRPVAADAEELFDPKAVVGGVVARQFAAALAACQPGASQVPGTCQAPSAAAAADGSRALDRLAARDYASAIAGFDAVLAADANNASAAFLLGWAYHGAGDDRQAISAWRRAAYVDPTLVSAHLALADMYVRLSQPALALQAVRAGLIALPQSPELLDRLSRLERR
jgi:VWFA-related protein